MGIRPVHTLARAGFLYIDHLVVTGENRECGAGRALMDHAEFEAA